MTSTNSEERAPPPNDGQLYTPKPGENQLTFRAVAAGCFLGWIVVAGNLYLGLTIGWSVGGSPMAALLWFAFFQVVSPTDKYTVLECNITQTAGSGAGTMARASVCGSSCISLMLSTGPAGTPAASSRASQSAVVRPAKAALKACSKSFK